MNEAITSALSTGFTQVSTDVTSIITTALPIALGVMGVMLALRIGIKFFKRSVN